MKRNTDNPHLRKGTPLGDAELITGLFLSGEELVQIGHSRSWGKWILIGKLFLFLKTILGYSVGNVLRWNWGNRACGVIGNVLTICLLVVWNSTQVHTLLKPVIWLLSPILGVVKRHELEQIVFEDIHSEAMLYYTIVFAAFSLFNVVFSWTPFGTSDFTKRGHSFILAIPGLSKYVSNYFVQGVLEPAILTAAGLAFYFYAGDLVFAVFLWSGAASLFALELSDLASQRTAHTVSFEPDMDHSKMGF